MKILVTGGLGFIGHNVVARLEAAGHDVVVTDIRTNYGVVPDSELNYLMSHRLRKIQTKALHRVDIADAGSVNWLIHKYQPAIVIHMASFPRQKVVNADPARGSQTMIGGLLNLCESAARHHVCKFVYISSSMVYGDFGNNVTEDYPCRPQGQYGIMKLCGEELVKDYHRRGAFDYTVIRPSAVYGPLDVENRVVAKFMLTAMRGGNLHVNGAEETLDFTYVDDAAEGIVAAALSTNTSNQTYNITRGRGESLLHAAELAVRIAGRGTIEINNKDAAFPSRSSLNIDAAVRDFGYSPTVDIAQGFQEYYNWLSNSSYWRHV
jgi:UDP-glucose 4-epimerase